MLNFASAGRNIGPISNVLQKEISVNNKQVALELASGSGQHVVHHASTFPNVHWMPTDIEDEHIASINAYIDDSGLENISKARYLDASKEDWGIENESLDIIINVNLIHISPFEVCEGLLKGAGKLLKKGGILIFYGPFAENGVLTPQSNVDFDASLRSRNSSWGIRDITEVRRIAKEFSLVDHSNYDMPANNKMFIFKKE